MMKKFTFFMFAFMAVFAFSACSDDDDDITKSSEKQIIEFSVNGTNAEIDQTNKKITLTLPAGTEITKLKPQVKISDKASVNPISEAETDFTNAVTYTVTAEDGSAQDYVVAINVQEPEAAPFLISKIKVTTEGESGYIEFSYNEDNTLAKYTVKNDESVEYMSFVFSYDASKKLTEVKIYEEKALYETYTYQYPGDNKVEVKVVNEDNPDKNEPNNPRIYTMNEAGLPIKMEQKGFKYEVENEHGSMGTITPTITREYTYNTDNTFSKIIQTNNHEFLEEPFIDTDTYEFKYNADSNHPLKNLPSGNLYLYENILMENSIGITGNGAFSGNCTSYNYKAYEYEKFEDFQTVYEYDEHKFPVKAKLTTTIEDTDVITYDLTFEYILK